MITIPYNEGDNKLSGSILEVDSAKFNFFPGLPRQWAQSHYTITNGNSVVYADMGTDYIYLDLTNPSTLMIFISFHDGAEGANGDGYIGINVDGVITEYMYHGTAWGKLEGNPAQMINVAPGSHVVKMQYKTQNVGWPLTASGTLFVMVMDQIPEV